MIKKYNLKCYSQGYIVAPLKYSLTDYNLPDHFIIENINNNYFISYDIKLRLCKISKENCHIVIIGHIYDISNYNNSIEEIANNILSLYLNNKFSNLRSLKILDYLAGRYVVIIFEDIRYLALNDACGLKSIYYHEKYDIIASHYGLINNFSHDNFSEIIYDNVRNEYYLKKYAYPSSLPADRTNYENIKLLTPNNLIIIPSHKIIRFWPLDDILDIDVEVCADYIAKNLKLLIERVAQDYNLLVSFTAGFDSRITLSACRDIKNDLSLFTYYTNEKKNLALYNDSQRNIRFVKDVALTENIKHYELDLSRIRVTPQLKQFFKTSHQHLHSIQIPLTWFEYNLIKENTIHVRSNCYEVIRRSNYNQPMKFNQNSLIKHMAQWASYKEDTEAYKISLQYWEEYFYKYNLQSMFNLGYNYGDIYFLEYRMGQWMSSVAIESDVACDTFFPINCRKFFQYAFSIPKHLKDKNILAQKIIETNWSDLIYKYNYPNNLIPTNSISDYNKNITAAGPINIYNLIKNHQTFYISSGNIENNESNNIHFYKSYSDAIVFSFSTRNINKNDYVQLTLNFINLYKKHYRLCFNLHASMSIISEVDNNKCHILTDSKSRYIINLSELQFPIYFLYLFSPINNKMTLNIKVVSGSTTKNNNFLIKLSNLFISPDTEYKRKDYFVSSTDLMKKSFNIFERLCSHSF